MAAFWASVGWVWNNTRVRPDRWSKAIFQPLPVIVVPIQGLSVDAAADLSCTGAGFFAGALGLSCTGWAGTSGRRMPLLLWLRFAGAGLSSAAGFAWAPAFFAGAGAACTGADLSTGAGAACTGAGLSSALGLSFAAWAAATASACIGISALMCTRTGISGASAAARRAVNTYTSPLRASEYDAGKVWPFTVTEFGAKFQVFAVVVLFMVFPSCALGAVVFLAGRLAPPTQKS